MLSGGYSRGQCCVPNWLTSIKTVLILVVLICEAWNDVRLRCLYRWVCVRCCDSPSIQYSLSTCAWANCVIAGLWFTAISILMNFSVVMTNNDINANENSHVFNSCHADLFKKNHTCVSYNFATPNRHSWLKSFLHYSDVIMSAMASQISRRRCKRVRVRKE